MLGAAPLLISLPLVVSFLREKVDNRVPKATTMLAGATVRVALQNQAFWIVASTLFLTAMSTTGILTHLPSRLTDRGLSPRIFGTRRFG